MGGGLAVAAEIVGSAHQSSPEVVLPDAVRHDAAQQRLLIRGQPLGEGGAAARHEPDALRLVEWRAIRQGRRESWLDQFAFLPEIPVGQHVGFGHGLLVPQDLGARVGIRSVQVGLAEALEHLAPLLRAQAPLGRLGHALEDSGLLEQGERARVRLHVVQAHQRYLRFHAACEERRQPVVFALADRIGLVVVAAGALQGQAEERRSDRIDGLGAPLGAVQVAVVGVFDGEGSQREQAGADPAADVSALLFRQLERSFQVHVGRPQLVGGDLLAHERVIGLVTIERLDHVVPVAPCGGVEVVCLEPGRVRVAHQVEPVTAPALPVSLRLQQPVDQLLVGIRGAVFDKLLNRFRGWRQAVQVKVGAASEDAAGSRLGRTQALLAQLGQHEGVDRVLHPAIVGQLRHCLRDGTLERPPSVSFISCGSLWPPGTGVDPICEGIDLLVRQPRVPGRHGNLGGSPDCTHQQACCGVARNYGGAARAARERARFAAKVEPGHARLPVAGRAVCVDDGLGRFGQLDRRSCRKGGQRQDDRAERAARDSARRQFERADVPLALTVGELDGMPHSAVFPYRDSISSLSIGNEAAMRHPAVALRRARPAWPFSPIGQQQGRRWPLPYQLTADRLRPRPER